MPPLAVYTIWAAQLCACSPREPNEFATDKQVEAVFAKHRRSKVVWTEVGLADLDEILAYAADHYPIPHRPAGASHSRSRRAHR